MMGSTPFLLSIVGSKDLDSFKFLFSLPDTNIKAVDNLGDGVFHYVFLSSSNRLLILNILFEHLDFNTVFDLINSPNHKGASAFHYLVRDFNEGIADLVFDKGLIDFSKTTNEGNTLLHTASSIPNIEAIEFLVKKAKFMVRKKNHFGLTPLQVMLSHPSSMFSSTEEIQKIFLNNVK